MFSDDQAQTSLFWLGWFDGCALPNPGNLGLGGVLSGPNGQSFSISKRGGYGDSTTAEYLALQAVLQCALDHHVKHAVLRGDSQVVIDDVLEKKRILRIDCQTHWTTCKTLMAGFKSCQIIWIPRAKNMEADILARQALSAKDNTMFDAVQI